MKPVEKLQTMQQGDTVQGTPLFAGLLTEPVKVKVRSMSEKGVRTLDITFMGIKLASVAAKPGEGKIIWAEVQ